MPLGSVLGYLARPGARQRNDASAAMECNASRSGLELPVGLSMQWLGTAGFAIGYEGYRILIDPFVTRPSLETVVRNRVLRPRTEEVHRLLGRADAILVGHTHFDHAMDIPMAASAADCKVFGSNSLAALMGLSGMPERASRVKPNVSFDLGPFKVTFVPSVHSKLMLGLRVNSEGELTCDHLDGLNNRTYCCGQVWGIHIEVAGHTFYHLGSANLIEDEMKFGPVDYLLCGIAGRGFTPAFVPRILKATQPAAIIPHHYDNFFLPLDIPMGFSFNVNFGGFVEEVHRHAPGLPIHTLSPLQIVGE
jgi:L-ascorbate metabolism protein UlaG (beta-lactamase superfamily)